MFFVVEVYYWSAFFSYFRMSNLGKGTLLQSLYKTDYYVSIIYCNTTLNNVKINKCNIKLIKFSLRLTN